MQIINTGKNENRQRLCGWQGKSGKVAQQTKKISVLVPSWQKNIGKKLI